MISFTGPLLYIWFILKRIGLQKYWLSVKKGQNSPFHVFHPNVNTKGGNLNDLIDKLNCQTHLGRENRCTFEDLHLSHFYIRVLQVQWEGCYKSGYVTEIHSHTSWYKG